MPLLKEVIHVADVSFPRFFVINAERLVLEPIRREQLKEGEIYLMLLNVVDQDDYDIVEDNLHISQKVENHIWIGYHSMLVVKYLGNATLEASDGLRIRI